MPGLIQAFRVLNKMVEDKILSTYAISGAVAALNYIEPTMTYDLDVLIPLDDSTMRGDSGLATLAPIFSYLREAGYTEFRQEGLLVEGWPVQFIPVAHALDAERLNDALTIAVESESSGTPITIRVLRPEHLVATALRIDRPKDRIRITQFLEEGSVNLDILRRVLDRHGLGDAWSNFCRWTGTSDPFDVPSGQ